MRRATLTEAEQGTREVARPLRYGLAALAGTLLLAWLVHVDGAEEVGQRLIGLGPVLPLALAPYTLSSLFDALGWRATLRAFDLEVPFVRLWLVRLAGEAVNSIAPTGVGGEPLKVLLLRADGMRGAPAAAAVVASRTAVTVTQSLLVVFGIVALLGRLGRLVAAPIALVGLLALTGLFGLVLVRVQQGGFAQVLARGLARLLPSTPTAARIERRATDFDARLATVYETRRPTLLVAAAWHMLGWLASAAEVWVLLRLLGVPISATDALIVEGLAQPIRATCILIPGALGTQEGGGVALCQMLGIPPGIGLTLWIVRRAREVVFDAIGLLYLPARNLSRMLAGRARSGTGPAPAAGTTGTGPPVSRG